MAYCDCHMNYLSHFGGNITVLATEIGSVVFKLVWAIIKDFKFKLRCFDYLPPWTSDIPNQMELSYKNVIYSML